MTATWQQTQAELPRLLELVRRGEDVVITAQGQPVARLSGVPAAAVAPLDRARWLGELTTLRTRVATGSPSGASVEEILAADRGE